MGRIYWLLKLKKVPGASFSQLLVVFLILGDTNSPGLPSSMIDFGSEVPIEFKSQAP